MFVGYPYNHSEDVYRLFNIKTSQVIKSIDLIWLGKDYRSWVSKSQDNQSGFGDPISDDDSDTTTKILISKETDLQTKLDPSNMKICNETKQLKTLFNAEASKVMEVLLSGRETMLEGTDVAFILADNPGEPTKFH
jgi:hypothetical protein